MNKWTKIFGTCSIIVIVAIFMFSTQPSVQTGKTSKLLVKPIENVLKKNTEKSFENSKTEKRYWRTFEKKLTKLVRKSAHVFNFAMLGFFVYMTVVSCKINGTNKFIIAFLFCVLYAVSDEIHQIFVLGREALVSDVFIDSLGIVVGIIIANVLIKFKNFWQAKT